jgi:WD repeat-containing protein 7
MLSDCTRFPTVDFHATSQRLAVGTSEGAAIMYDLKTATRLYVLEGHKKRLSCCSFSPDGRRLVTTSLEEGAVLVWKVGTSFSSFFNPGAPPRQGHSGSDPYKNINFNVGDEGVFFVILWDENILILFSEHGHRRVINCR